MSWLLLDAGNTTLKWEALDEADASWPGDADPGPQAARRNGTVPVGSSPGLESELRRACSSGATPAAVFGCAVTSAERIAAIGKALQAAGAPAVRWLGASAEFEHDGVRVGNRYDDPQRLGADRWHALIGARARFARGPVLLICAGTATTVDSLAGDGSFLGGVIAPGVEMMRRSLAEGTAQLPLAAGAYAAHPGSTPDAIQTGVLDAQMGLVERRMRRLREAVGGGIQVLVSGGSAQPLLRLLSAQIDPAQLAFEPDIVLRGLWHAARRCAAQDLLKPAQ
jgi:type III pantothenate kinase